MPGILDEFVIKVGWDPAEMEAGARQSQELLIRFKDETSKTASRAEADGKKAARFYSEIKSEALSLIAVLVGAKSIEDFTAKQVTGLAAAGRIAKVMGMATPDILAVSMAVERIGGNADAAKQSMLALSQALERYSRFGEGSIEFKRGLGMIGAGPGDTPLQILQKFATWSQGKKGQDVELIGQQIGLNQDLINEAIQGRKQFDADIAESYKIGIPSDGDIKKVTDLQKAFIGLSQALRQAGIEGIKDFAEPLAHMMDSITHLIEKFPHVTKLVLELAAAFITLKTATGLFGVGKALMGGAGAAAEGTGAGIGTGLTIGGAAAVSAFVLPLVIPSQLGSDSDATNKTIRAIMNGKGAGVTPREVASAMAVAQRNLGYSAPGSPEAKLWGGYVDILLKQWRLMQHSAAYDPNSPYRHDTIGLPSDALGVPGLHLEKEWGAGLSPPIGRGLKGRGPLTGPFSTPGIPNFKGAGSFRGSISTADTGLTGRAQRAFQKLMSAGLGLTAEQARGMVAVTYAESGLDPGAFNAKGGGQGALGTNQWRGDRQRALRAFAKARGSSPTDFDTDIDFMIAELAGKIRYRGRHGGTMSYANALSALRGTGSAMDTAQVFLLAYEGADQRGFDSDMGRVRRFLGQGGGGSRTVNIDQINIQTQATDAAGIARDLERQISLELAANSNGAMN